MGSFFGLSWCYRTGFPPARFLRKVSKLLLHLIPLSQASWHNHIDLAVKRLTVTSPSFIKMVARQGGFLARSVGVVTYFGVAENLAKSASQIVRPSTCCCVSILVPLCVSVEQKRAYFVRRSCSSSRARS